MSGGIDSFYFFIIGAALLLSVMGLWFCTLIPGIDRWDRRFFLGYFFVILLSCVSLLAEMALHYYPVPDAVTHFLLLLGTLLLSLPLPMQTAYLLHCCGEDLRCSKLLYAALGLSAAFFVLIASIPFTDGFVSFTAEGQYFRGPLYPLLLAPTIAVLLLNFAGTLGRRARLSRKTFVSFIAAEAPMAIALTANLFVDAVPVFDISYVLSALAMYGLVLSDQIEQDRSRQREIAMQQRQIAHERASVMVLRMRPHFIYNTLMSIHSLCRLDPRKAEQLTADFTDYLRKNFNAVASEEPVPFSAELEHARAYLAVEQAQYEDMLAVDLDTPHVGFRLPPLTLQPLVENAVKHGMGPDTVPLQVRIRTRRTGAGSVVVVEDGGPGFDAAVADDPSTTLFNIRQRLEMTCGGTLEIAPREGGGTVAKVTIPGRE